MVMVPRIIICILLAILSVNKVRSQPDLPGGPTDTPATTTTTTTTTTGTTTTNTTTTSTTTTSTTTTSTTTTSTTTIITLDTQAECITYGGTTCVFPFTYAGTIYNGCAPFGGWGWCATSLTGTSITSWHYCVDSTCMLLSYNV